MNKAIEIKRRRIHLLIAAMLIFGSTVAWAGGVKVIANSSVQANSVSIAELKSVYLEEKNSLSDGTHVQPVLTRGGPAYETFVREYLDKSDPALQIYYRSLVFTGKGLMPKVVQSEADMVAYIAKTKGAIGYVSAGASVEGVRVLEVK